MYAGLLTMGLALLAVRALFLIGGDTRMVPNEKGVTSAVTILTNSDYAYPAVFALLILVLP
jgi:hypothetical protein